MLLYVIKQELVNRKSCMDTELIVYNVYPVPISRRSMVDFHKPWSQAQYDIEHVFGQNSTFALNTIIAAPT